MKAQFIPSKNNNICYINKIPTWHCDVLLIKK